ncbi:RNA polymerase factor sigma-54 [Brachyspira pilosicoli]|uniref:RNA polymerase factor sigma-54 n=1 Tax=Brachyspira pilosicoli TaxID=52584 RepID=A0AAJ6KCH6_BRAPL|nr:RNA polymerase factor sigma-54 [Brachyspira pilosicoli]WIH89445.1 RNA polymerase factor sigma-54 [Brachyspira pilosicoli]WIH91739.1 RNA polymerase factor sigma-54 [Brachyspira pilosicoli]WIH93967.1 RNA polymerase factor sigma-54 [Brachyspira pilosicoli]
MSSSINLSTNIKTQLRHELRLNAQTKLWLDTISMPAIELKEKIEKEMEENPFLEYDFKNTSNKDIDNIIENTLQSEGESLFEHLKTQINIAFDNKKDIELAEHICSFIDKDGYIKTPYETISETLNANIKDVQRIINILKTFDPLGVCAKDIGECLSIQLKSRDDIEESIKEIAIKIVENFLKELGNKNYDYIANEINITKDKVLEALKIIQTLEPYPAREYDTTPIKYIVPEIFIFKENNEWVVKTNESFIKPLKISKKYSKLINEGKNSSREDINFLKEKKKMAESLINAVSERKKTLLKVGEGLLKFQLPFFENGKEFVKPLKLQDLSLEVSLSESTISRISNGKYLNTVWGTFSIKYFFSKELKGGVSSRAVKEIIKRIIKDSPAKLTDEKIRLILKSEGIDISRRTVAKYRLSSSIL